MAAEPPTEATTTSTAATFVATPPTERYVEGTVDFYRWVADCVAENGGVAEVWEGNPPAIAGGDGLVTRCWDTARDNDWYEPFPEGVDAARLTYRMYVEVHACLEANGYPTVEPPSEEAFIASWPTLSWNPYAGMGRGLPITSNPDSSNPADSEQLEAQQLCGADVPTLWAEELAEQEGPGDSP